MSKKRPVYDQLPKFDKKGNTFKNGVTNLDNVEGKKGVYKLYERGQLVFIGYSAKDLKAAILSHFYKYQGRKRPASNYRHRLGQYSYEYLVEECPRNGCRQIEAKAQAMIQKYKPRDNQ